MEDKRKSIPSVTDAPHFRQAYDDEISLIDLWLVLVRHRRVIFIVTAVITVLAVVYASVRSPRYSYTTTIEIGTQVENERTVPVESPETVLAKVTESYLPDVLHTYYRAHPDDKYRYKITARVPKNSQLIVLESKAPESKGKVLVEVEDGVVAALEKDHARITSVIRSGFALEKQQAEQVLARLVDKEKTLKADLGRIDTNAALLRAQIKDTKSVLANVRRNQSNAIHEAKGEARAMAMLLIDNEIQQNRSELAKLEEELTIKLGEKRDALNAKLADNAHDQQTQQQVIKNVDLKTQNLRETRAVVPPVRSIDPVGLDPIVIVLLGLIAGLLLGVFSAFGLEFLAQARVAGEAAANPDSTSPAAKQHAA